MWTEVVEDLGKDLEDARREIEQLKKKRDSVEEGFRGELEEEKTKNQQLREQVSAAQAHVEALTKDKQKLTTNVEKFKSQLESSEREKKDLTTTVGNLKNQLDIAQTESLNLTTQVGNLRTDLGTAQTESQNLTTQVKKLQTELGNAQTESQNLKTEVKKLENELKGALKNNTDLLNDVGKLCTDIQHLTTQIQLNHPYQSLRCCVLLIVMYFSVGITFCVRYAKNFTGMIKGGNLYVNAIYYMVITAFTIGFGDIHPDDIVSKLLTCFFVVLGVHVVNILIILQSYVWTKLKNKYLSTVSEPKRTRIITGLAVVAVFCSIFGGMMGICAFENGENVNRIEDYTMNSTDSFYLSVMSLSTEGFGDISFKTIAGRVFAVIWLVMFHPMYFSAMAYLMDLAVKTIIGYCCCYQFPETNSQV